MSADDSRFSRLEELLELAIDLQGSFAGVSLDDVMGRFGVSRRTATRMLGSVRRAVGAPGLLISQFNGEAAGQTVPHVHFHIIPRFPGLKLKAHAREKGDSDRLEQIAARIMGELDAQRG